MNRSFLSSAREGFARKHKAGIRPTVAIASLVTAIGHVVSMMPDHLLMGDRDEDLIKIRLGTIVALQLAALA